MSGNTIFFRCLKKRIASIERNFCPKMKPNGDYTQKEEDNIRAYLFLTHAELEFYFEEVAQHKSKNAYLNFKKNHSFKSTILMSICAYDNSNKKGDNFVHKVEHCHTEYVKSLVKNNGIKNSNITNILLPLGILDSEIDQTWLSTLSSFGSTRGEIAHKSASAQQKINPQDIKNNIILILKELDILDQKIKKLS